MIAEATEELSEDHDGSTIIGHWVTVGEKLSFSFKLSLLFLVLPFFTNIYGGIELKYNFQPHRPQMYAERLHYWGFLSRRHGFCAISWILHGNQFYSRCWLCSRPVATRAFWTGNITFSLHLLVFLSFQSPHVITCAVLHCSVWWRYFTFTNGPSSVLFQVWVGNPAKYLRDCTDEELEFIDKSSAGYQVKWLEWCDHNHHITSSHIVKKTIFLMHGRGLLHYDKC